MADLTPYQEPSWQKRAANSIADGLMWMGMDGRRAQRFGDTASVPFSFLPPVAAHDAGVIGTQGYTEGDPAKVGMGVLGAGLATVPVAGSMIRNGMAASRDRAMADLLRHMPGRTHFDNPIGMREQIIGNLEGRYGPRMSEGYTDPVMMGRWRHDTPDIPHLTRGARPEYLSDDKLNGVVVPANETNLTPPPRTISSKDNWRRYETWSDGWRDGGENPAIYRVDTPAEVSNPDNPLRFRTKTDTSEVFNIERAIERNEDRLKVLGSSERDAIETANIYDRLGELRQKLDEVKHHELMLPHNRPELRLPPDEATLSRDRNWYKSEDGQRYIGALRQQRENRAAARDNVYPMEQPRRSSGGNVGGNDSLTRALDLARSIAQQYPTQ